MTGSIAPSTLGLLLTLVVLVATLVNRFAPNERAHVRRVVTLFGLTCLGWALERLLGAAAGSWAAAAGGATLVLAGFTMVASLGVALFDVALPKLRVRVPTIAAELLVGAAYVVALLVVLRRFGLEPASLLTTSAIVTGVLALSLQATLGNVIGGVALQLDDSIRVGDWVQLENGRQGAVREIRWRHTVIETSDWDTLIVPNAQLLASAFTILGKRAGEPMQHRMRVQFNVDFRFGPADVIRTVESALREAAIEGVASDPLPQVICYDLARDGGDSMAYYSVRYWLTDLAADDAASSRVRVRVYAALKRADIPLAVPAAHLWVEQDSPERRARKLAVELERRRRALRTSSFFRPLHDAEIDSLAERVRYTPFAAGETLTSEGAVAHSLYILSEGRAEVRLGGMDGATIATIEGPDVIGELGLMTGAPRTATVVAVTDLECYRLDKDAFHSILAARPELAAEMSALVAGREESLPSLRADLEAGKRAGADDERLRLVDAVRRFFGLQNR